MIELSCVKESFDLEIDLPGSKSIHNRVLILDALYELGLIVTNPSTSADSILLKNLLKSGSKTFDCENAGTVMRFLTAYSAINSDNTILTGNSRMLSRPIGPLVGALQTLGANIDYTGNVGFPPIRINRTITHGGIISVNGSISSQYISALVMIGARLQGGLTLFIEGNVSSKPYIQMTVDIMRSLGFNIRFENKGIIVSQWSGESAIKRLEIEPDWSGVAFWFQIVSFTRSGKVLLKNLKTDSLQGDSVLAKWAGRLGIEVRQEEYGISLQKAIDSSFEDRPWELINFPDLAPSIIVLLAVQKRKATLTGLGSLKIKESDRTLALQKELDKCGVIFYEINGEWKLDATHFKLEPGTFFENYEDHRIAMALACLSFIEPIKMKDPDVVKKSYPEFWDHLKQTGILINHI